MLISMLVVIEKAWTIINNLLRSTVSRSEDFMLTLFVSHICPKRENRSYLWSVG